VAQGFDLHPLAAQDVTDIWTFIAEDSPQAARRVREDLIAAIRGLVPFPRQGHKRPDLTSRPLRFIVVREYLIAYAPDERPLWVVAAMHGRRNPRVMAAILRVENKHRTGVPLLRIKWVGRFGDLRGSFEGLL
jgi:toxin ParE1/3/4